jgi:hypothetical protein
VRAPLLPTAPTFGAGFDSAAGGGSGIFFFALAALLALLGAYVPGYSRLLLGLRSRAVPAPLLALPARPG